MLERDVSPGIRRVADGDVNWYIVTDDSGVPIVDSGCPVHCGLLENALRQLRRSPRDVRALLLTHAHYDHTGFAKRIHGEWRVPVHLAIEDGSLARHPALSCTERLPLVPFRNRGFDPCTLTSGPRLVARAATADSQLDLRSLDHLAATQATTLLTGHGEPWTGAAEAVRLARAAEIR